MCDKFFSLNFMNRENLLLWEFYLLVNLILLETVLIKIHQTFKYQIMHIRQKGTWSYVLCDWRHLWLSFCLLILSISIEISKFFNKILKKNALIARQPSGLVDEPALLCRMKPKRTYPDPWQGRHRESKVLTTMFIVIYIFFARAKQLISAVRHNAMLTGDRIFFNRDK